MSLWLGICGMPGWALILPTGRSSAEQLASQFDAEAILLADVTERLPDADIVISSRAVSYPFWAKALSKRR